MDWVGRVVGEGLLFRSMAVLGIVHRIVESPMSYHVAKTLVFNRVKNSIGFDHCHIFISGAAPLSRDTAEFFLSLDIPIGEMYGMSETSGPHTAFTMDNLRMLRYWPPG